MPRNMSHVLKSVWLMQPTVLPCPPRGAVAAAPLPDFTSSGQALGLLPTWFCAHLPELWSHTAQWCAAPGSAALSQPLACCRLARIFVPTLALWFPLGNKNTGFPLWVLSALEGAFIAQKTGSHWAPPVTEHKSPNLQGPLWLGWPGGYPSNIISPATSQVCIGCPFPLDVLPSQCLHNLFFHFFEFLAQMPSFQRWHLKTMLS